MARIVYTPRADNDLVEIARFLTQASRNRDVALRFLDLVAARSETYASHPQLAESCPELGQSVRRFPIGSYVVFYRPIDDGIELLRVLHGARDIPAVWKQR
jgi:toxin ParE1/3/4